MWEVLAFFKCVDVVLCSSAGDSLEEWQLKYPLQTQLLMDGNLDKRKTNGLNKRARKLLQSKDPETRLHGQMLQAYHSQLELLSKISSKNIKHTTAAELSRWLVLVQEEGLSLTSSQKRALVARKCSLALQAQNFIEVLDIMDPFQAVESFNPMDPKLANLDDPQREKVSTFVSIVTKDCLLPALDEGASGRQKLSDYCKMCLANFQTVDWVELEQSSAVALSNCTTVWKIHFPCSGPPRRSPP